MTTHGTIEWVCQQWAKQARPSAESRHGRVFFEGDTLYSWGKHYPLGQITTGPDGKPLVLINESKENRGDSVSTTNHRRCASRAAYQRWMGKCVVHGVISGIAPFDPEREIAMRLEAVQETLATGARCRKAYGKTWTFLRAELDFREGRELAHILGVPFDHEFTIPAKVFDKLRVAYVKELLLGEPDARDVGPRIEHLRQYVVG